MDQTLWLQAGTMIRFEDSQDIFVVPKSGHVRITQSRPSDACRITKVLDASREYCYHSTPENREKLKQALEEYGNGR